MKNDDEVCIPSLSSILLTALGFCFDGSILARPCFILGLDQMETSLLLGKFQLSGFDPNAETLILTECSTTYIHADQCENLLNMLTNYLKKFVYISYEQIRKEVFIFFSI